MFSDLRKLQLSLQAGMMSNVWSVSYFWRGLLYDSDRIISGHITAFFKECHLGGRLKGLSVSIAKDLMRGILYSQTDTDIKNLVLSTELTM